MADTIGQTIFSSQDMAGTLISPTLNLTNLVHYAVHLGWTGTPTGTLYLEANVEASQTLWETVASVPVSGAGSQMWLDRNAPYTRVRLRYVPTASTGTIDGIMVAKGDK